MKRLIVLFAAVALSCGVQYDGLRVKYGWSDALADSEYFFKIPRTITDAETEGWKRTERPPGALSELRMYCPPGRGVCPLYDAGGFVAGLQIALPVDDFESLAIKPEKKFVKWRAPASEGEPSRDYWTLTQYYVSEESLKAGSGPQIENGATLQDGGVWVTGLDGRLLRIPTSEADLASSTLYKKQNCVPNMGTHYYYNMTKDMKCEDLLPWFTLVNKGELIGTGFMMVGKLATQKTRHWFEIPPSPKQLPEIVLPFAPDCFHEWADSYGIVSLHIYYINDPWNIRCQKPQNRTRIGHPPVWMDGRFTITGAVPPKLKNGDSIRPAPAYERLLLNGYRYANQISDELKKLFSG